LPLTALKAVSELLIFNLSIKEQKVEECDATKAQSGNKSW